MSATEKPVAKKTAAKKTPRKANASPDDRRQLSERLQKIRDGSEILTAELDRLRQRLTARL